jgi:hypothetical protein
MNVWFDIVTVKAIETKKFRLTLALNRCGKFIAANLLIHAI